MQRHVLLIALSTCGAMAPVAVSAQLPDPAVLDRISRSVVRVEARQCDGPDLVGTGFVWGDPGQVVTALHLVAGCDAVVVYSERFGITRRGRIARVLLEADLALLDIAAPELPRLLHVTSVPAVNAQVVAMGYKLGAPTMGTVNLDISYGSRTLRDIVPRSVAQRIEQAGSPSVSLQVLNLQGHLLPGLSGAPVIDNVGRVVAIANGGLEGGAASISWAIPAARLNQLSQAGNPTPTTYIASRELFSAAIESAPPPESAISCGQLQLVRVRRRTLAALRSTTDDPQGLSFLEQLGSLGDVDMGQLEYDIYVDVRNGGTIAVPAGNALRAESGSCVVQFYGGAMRLVIAGYSSANPQVSEEAFLSGLGVNALTWQQDPIQPSGTPSWRPDGLIAKRSSFTGYEAALFGAVPRANLFVTTVSLRSDFVGTAVINAIPENIDGGQSAMLACAFDTPQCATITEQMRQWIWLMAGSYFTTFPVG